MSTTTSTKKNSGFYIWLFIYFLIAIASLIGHIIRSSQKYFWLDEYYGLFSSMRVQSYLDLVINGAASQGSPAPLFYILGKLIDDLKDVVSYLGLPYSSYFRLPFNILFHISAILYAYILSKTVLKKHEGDFFFKSGFIILLGLCAYLFIGHQVGFLEEFRAYSLWNILWFVSILYLAQKITDKINPVYLSILYGLLVMTSTASVFQIFALYTTDVIIKCLMHRDFTKIIISLKKHTISLIVPILVSLLYLSKVTNSGYPDATWEQYLDIINYYRNPLIISFITCILCLLNKDFHKYLVYTLPNIILLLLSPVVLYLIQRKSFFIADRQFLYFDLGFVLSITALFHIIMDMKNDLKKISRYIIKTFYYILVYFIFTGAIHSIYLYWFINEDYNYNSFGPVINPETITRFQKTNNAIPGNYQLSNLKNKYLQNDLKFNAELFNEWLHIRHNNISDNDIVLSLENKKLKIVSIEKK